MWISDQINPEQFQILLEIIHGKRVLDIGDDESPFLAPALAVRAKKWTVVGRGASAFIPDLPPNISMHTHPFDAWSRRPLPSLFDVVLISWNYTGVIQIIECLKWLSPEQILVVIGPSEDEHSTSFWHLFQPLLVFQQIEGTSRRMLVLQKSAAESAPFPTEEKEPRAKLLKGDRFHLAAGAKWPGRRSDDRPPVVEIIRDWDRDSGPVKIVKTGVVFYIQKGDLGSAM